MFWVFRVPTRKGTWHHFQKFGAPKIDYSRGKCKLKQRFVKMDDFEGIRGSVARFLPSYWICPRSYAAKLALNECGGATRDMYVTRHSRATVGNVEKMWVHGRLQTRTRVGDRYVTRHSRATVGDASVMVIFEKSNLRCSCFLAMQ